ncbi:MAG: acyltransferase [Clostridia bacterium]|nr:acyltransferase [Clostridia bacterium]
MANVKKKQELNVLNVFLCILVVFIHAVSEAVTGLPRDSASFAVLYMAWKAATVAVPAFLFVSGVKLSLSLAAKPQSFGKFFAGKLLKIYLPYVLYVVLYYVSFVLCKWFPFEVKALCSYIFIGDLAAHFYFIVILMQFFLLMPLLKWLIERYNATFLLGISLLITLLFGQFLPDILRALSGGRIEFLYNDRLFTSYLFYYVLGMIVGRKYNAFTAFLKENKGLIVFFGAFVLILNVGFSYYERKAGVWFGFSNLVHMTYCMGVLPLLCLAAKSISKCKFFESGFFKTANAASFGVYLMHLLVMFILNEYLKGFGLLEAFGIRFVVVLMLSFALCMGYVRLKQKLLKKEK